MAEVAVNDLQITKSGILHFGESPLSSSNLTLNNEIVVQICCGHDHSAIVCESGRVYTFGKNKYDQLGLENVGDKVSEPTLVAALTSMPIVQVACGCHFTYFLSASGHLYSCGRNRRGQLGQGQKSERVCSLPLQTSNKVAIFKKVAAGMCHAVALMVNGSVLVCGSSSQGQMGLGQRTFNAYLFPIPELPHPSPIIDISCGGFHTALLSESGQLYMAGCNDKGQLGLDTNSPCIRNYTPVPLPSTVTAMACGSSHTLALTSDGTVWAWGSNVFGQQGTGNNINNFAPEKMIGLENRSIVKVFAGENSSALVTDNGDILLCGCGKEGQTGQEREDLNVPTPVVKLPELIVKQVACAATYVLMLVGPPPEKSH